MLSVFPCFQSNDRDFIRGPIAFSNDDFFAPVYFVE